MRGFESRLLHVVTTKEGNMKDLTVEQLEWLITLTEERAREMVESPEKEMLKKTANQLRELRVEAKEA